MAAWMIFTDSSIFCPYGIEVAGQAVAAFRTDNLERTLQIRGRRGKGSSFPQIPDDAGSASGQRGRNNFWRSPLLSSGRRCPSCGR